MFEQIEKRIAMDQQAAYKNADVLSDFLRQNNENGTLFPIAKAVFESPYLNASQKDAVARSRLKLEHFETKVSDWHLSRLRALLVRHCCAKHGVETGRGLYYDFENI